MKKVLVTGILGQDGANMAEFLLRQGEPIMVYGMMRRSSNPNFVNAKNFKDHPNFKFVFGDLSDDVSIDNVVRDIQPDYLINFAANSFVGCSWSMPEQVFETNALGVLRCLESIKKFKPECRFYSAGSSEEFGDVDYSPQDINHPIKPRSPYGASKAAARHLVKVYCESYDMYAVHGILFNHEGTKRGEEFVTRKITKGVARINWVLHNIDKWRERRGEPAEFQPIELGNIDSKRDWSDSEDFVEGVWLMLNQEKPKNYVLASGETHSIREFIEKAFKAAKFEGGFWEGEGVDERYYYMEGPNKHLLVKINPEFYRPAEVDLLLGNSIPIREELGWRPKSSFDKLVKKMVEFDINDQNPF
jgi:GDPmannose 4,6-dehydratase